MKSKLCHVFLSPTLDKHRLAELTLGPEKDVPSVEDGTELEI